MKLHSTEVSKKVMTNYKWLEWTIMDNHPFNFCENELKRQNTNLQDFSAHSLVCNLEKVTEKTCFNFYDKMRKLFQFF